MCTNCAHNICQFHVSLKLLIECRFVCNGMFVCSLTEKGLHACTHLCNILLHIESKAWVVIVNCTILKVSCFKWPENVDNLVLSIYSIIVLQQDLAHVNKQIRYTRFSTLLYLPYLYRRGVWFHSCIYSTT